MNRILKFSLIGCGGLIVLFIFIGIVGALVGAGSGTDTATQNDQNAEQAKDEVNEFERELEQASEDVKEEAVEAESVEQDLDEAIEQAEEAAPEQQPAPEEEAAPEGVIVRVTGESGQSFAGSYGNVDSTITVDGTVPQEYEVEVNDGLMEYDVVSGVMQKNTPGSWELGVEIVVDGEVVKEASTTAEFGVAQVTWDTTE